MTWNWNFYLLSVSLWVFHLKLILFIFWINHSQDQGVTKNLGQIMPQKIKINSLVENHKESQLCKCSVTVFVPKIAEIELNCTELIHFGRKEMELIDITSQCTSVQSHSSGNLKSITKIAYSSYFAEMLHFWLYLTGLPTSRTFQAFSLIISSVDCFWKYWKKNCNLENFYSRSIPQQAFFILQKDIN